MKLRVGTSGYAYKEWKGSFYPDRIAADRMLAFYAEHLSAVEINNTFYRLPSAKVLAGWKEQVPADFRFVLKASRRITHQKRLVDCADVLAYLLETAATLEDSLGALLFQLPPYLKKDLDRLASFLPLLGGARAAFEFRHPSWFDDDVFAALRGAGAALCLADTAKEEHNPPWTITADWGYLRLRREDYGPEDVAAWAARVAEAGWCEAFVFFKHEDEGAGPRLAAAFREAFASSGARTASA